MRKAPDSMRGFKLAVQETRLKSLFPRTGQVQASPSPAIWPEAKTMGQQQFPDLPQQISSPRALVIECP